MRRIEGLWLGGGISTEAAEVVEQAVREKLEGPRLLGFRQRAELTDLANAIRAQIQKAPEEPKPMSDLV